MLKDAHVLGDRGRSNQKDADLGEAMKKVVAQNPYRVRRDFRVCLKSIRAANVRRRRVFIEKRRKCRREVYLDTIQCRKAYIKRHYQAPQRTLYPEEVVLIPEHFGLELEQHVSSFFSAATNISQSNAKRIVIDFSNCQRVWPSAITFLCSFSQWVSALRKSEITVSHRPPSNPSAMRYLDHCGFLDYIGASKLVCSDSDDSLCDADIVKIKHEKSKGEDATVPFEEQVCEILRRCTDLTPEEIEIFNSVILTEIIINVTEHGMPIVDAGWWAIAQHHPKTGIVSICIADNGIGIRKSLMTGHQRFVLSREREDKPEAEGYFIRKALNENVSGAIDAAIKARPRKIFQSAQYAKGNRRGFGLHRIRDACKELGFRFSIVSNTGALMLDSSGREKLCKGFANKVFAGTMYHIIVPTKK